MSDGQLVVAAERGIRIATVADIQDALAVTFDTTGLLLEESDLAPGILDLRTGLLGELMQKFVNYRLRLALVVPDPERHGARIAELAYEHRNHALVRILPTAAAARAWLQAMG